MNLDDRDAMGITLATIDTHVCRALGVTSASDFGRGYNHAMRQIKAILDKHGAPPSEPVNFGNPLDDTPR